jgi:MarR family transcriptional regulator, organic hydroperoxide resistance regulator
VTEDAGAGPVMKHIVPFSVIRGIVPVPREFSPARAGVNLAGLDEPKTVNIVAIATLMGGTMNTNSFGADQVKLRLTIFPRIESPGFLIYRVATQIKVGLQRAFRSQGFNVTPEQWTVLSSLWEADVVHQSLLAEKTSKDRHNMTGILNLLEKAGLVRREPDRGDRRSQKVYLADGGRALKPLLVLIATCFLQKAFTEISQKDLNSMKRTLGQILNNLGSDSRSAEAPHYGGPKSGPGEQQLTGSRAQLGKGSKDQATWQGGPVS